jgi:hypothetical protein
MNVRDRFFPNYIVTNKTVVSHHILSISVPSDTLHIFTKVKVFTCRVIVSITKNVIIVCRQQEGGIYLRSGGKGL